MKKAQQIQVIYDYVKHCFEKRNVRISDFHRKYKPYERKQSTYDLLNKAKNKKIYYAPRIFVLQDTNAKLVSYRDVPLLDLYEEKLHDPHVFYVMILAGAYSLIYFQKGKKNLTHASCIFPTYPALLSFDTIDPAKHGKMKLSIMEKPNNWDYLDWKIYQERRNLINSSVEIGKKLGVSYQTVLDRFNKILNDCQMWLPFFPRGYKNYIPYILTMKTEYEVGMLKELKKLDRSTYVYKIDDTLILTLFFNKELEINSFLKMEKKGIIKNLSVSFPIYHEDTFW